MCYAFHLSILDSFIQTLYINLTDAFRTSHYVGWIHSLVGRNHDKFLCLVFYRQVSNDASAIHIVPDTLSRIIFHHRHMLVCCRMEYIVRTIHFEDFLHTHLRTYITHYRFRLNVCKQPGHHQADVMQWGFCLVYQNKFLRTEPGNLSDNFTTDTSCRSRYQYLFAGKQLSDCIQINVYWGTWQQVFYIHFLQLCMVYITLAIPFLNCWYHTDLYTLF